MRSKIGKRNVDALKPAQKDVILWDSEVKGFGVKITPKGRKVYVLQYRLNGGSTRRYTIGVHGAPWTPETARTRAISVLGDIAKGIDPMAAKRAARSDISVAQLCDHYLIEGVRTKKASTVTMDRSRIERHVKPLLGSKRLKTLTRAHIEQFMADLAAGKSAKTEKTKKYGRAIVRGGEGAANRNLGMLGSILEFAVEKGLRSDNPARGVKKYKERKCARFLSNNEMARLGDALRSAESSGVNRYAIVAIRLLMLTGCRKNEILTLKWDEVDFDAGFLRLGDSKTGAKDVHLTAPAREILAFLSRMQGNPHVIPGDGATGHFIGLQKVWKAIRDTAELSDVRLHDLRHTFASVGARSGESLLVIGKILGHATTAATSRYAHLSDDPAKSAANSIAAKIEASLSEHTADVVHLPKEKGN
ncbi:MAG: tyrosine-type recombinase/integrase [Alphaproteobacteria bacterium]|nr:tyrosine-type recombinase/integrase [Alphaproteobacteria bacterium]